MFVLCSYHGMERFDPLAAQSSDLSGWAPGEVDFARGPEDRPIGDLVRVIVARLEREMDRDLVDA